jgi:hypothetical protein
MPPAANVTQDKGAHHRQRHKGEENEYVVHLRQGVADGVAIRPEGCNEEDQCSVPHRRG